MGTLLKGIGNFLRGKRDEAAEKLKDDVRDGGFAIEDSKKKIAQYETSIAGYLATVKANEKKMAAFAEEIKKWNSIAIKAAKAGNEVDARQALAKKGEAKAQFDTMKKQVDQDRVAIEKLRNQLNVARQKVAQAESNLSRLSAQKEGAKIRKEMAKAAADFGGDDSPFGALDNLSKAVDTETAEAEAWEEMAGDRDPDGALEDKYSGTDAGVDDELAKLMAKHKKDE